MKSQVFRRILGIIGGELRFWPSAADFETAYHVRVAIDRIRFAIKHTEQFASPRLCVCGANLQLLDALELLESLDRRFQLRSRTVADRNGNGAGNRGPC